MNLLINTIKKEYIDELLKLHTEVFFNKEPITPKLGISIEDFQKIIREQLISSIEKGHSLGAFHNDKLIGFIICSPKKELSQLPKEQKEESNPFRKLDVAIEKLDLLLEEEPYKSKKLFHIETMGVDDNYVGHSLGKKLIEQAINLAKQEKFQYIYAECTNIFSERGMLNNGFEVIYQYAWKDSGIENFRDIQGNFSLTMKSLYE